MQLASRHETAKPPMALCEAQAQAWSEDGVQTEAMAAERQGLAQAGWPSRFCAATRPTLAAARRMMLFMIAWLDGRERVMVLIVW